MVLRSDKWFRRDDEVGVEHRAAMHAAGTPADGGRPVIGLLNSTSGLNPCNAPLTELAEQARQGVLDAGGIPVELATMSLGEDLMKPTAMLYRNLMAMEVEETLRANPIDGVVLLGNCDKTIPAQLMGAASADLPALQISGGYRRPGLFRGREVGAGTDLWSYWTERRAGRLDDGEWQALERALGCSAGACNVMGTALTMAMMAEVLGVMLPGAGTLASGSARLSELAYDAGTRIVRMTRAGETIGAKLTRAAFERALRALAAIGGSTNAIVHLIAIAGRRRIGLSLDDLAAAARAVPVLADVQPIGRHTIAAFDAAGGIQAVLSALESGVAPDTPVIRAPHSPVTTLPAFAVVRGNLAPDGAVVKTAATDGRLLRHTGPAVVFHGHDDLLARIDDPDLDVREDSVLVLTGCGPRGGDGFPEWGMMSIPKKLARRGVTDLVRISDARMSGTSFGTCVLHVAPEAAVGGPLAAVHDGDLITVDAFAGKLSVALSDEEIAGRLASLPRPSTVHRRGWPALYQRHVLQADRGADLDFLVPRDDGELTFVEPTIGRS
ncbi:dihydroxy-acid dehydratase domain-containing protein [Amycolatopsis pithecellobii]|uniref:Dihydroxy-acid dehydratase n=1 Tax=Amycolatopsis pithecellobii TaxID=664692 RepID=A0A6N7Z9Y8_9PSEU|nr:dihydroxy-acid dehydratase [Amycolatopsis pithecellobii]MTD58529.1 dihydroxy-acid dehydratase [Amycolatopsis pithecellobii]